MEAATKVKTTTEDRYREARNRGAAFLLAQLRPDGGFGPEDRGVSDYYKVACALHVCGETHAANRLCTWIREHGLETNGDFGPRADDVLQYAHAYYNSWAVIGAHRLGHYDISRKSMDFLMDFHDPESGGFYSSPTERSADTLQDIWVVCGAGRTALTMNRIDVAEGVGRWLKNMMEQQPNFPDQLYGVMSRSRGLITEPDPADEIRYVCNMDAERDQFFFNPGISAGFLCRLYQATGDREWLELAKEYMRAAEIASDYLLRLLRAGKVAWAASNLWTLTREQKYRKLAIRLGDMIVESQNEDGGWDSLSFMVNDASAEMTYWLDQLYQHVGHDPD
jgi:hypothetical protein